MNMADLERAVWKQIQEATEQRQTARLAHLGALADEMETRKKDWITRLGKPAESANYRPIVPPLAPATGADFTGRPIRAFDFAGTSVLVKTYKELLLGLANLLRQKHGEVFDRQVLSLSGRKRRYFATDPKELKYAHELDGGGLFAETNLNANLIVKICYEMLHELDYESTSLNLRS